MVDEHQVVPQEGDFCEYKKRLSGTSVAMADSLSLHLADGSWITPEITGGKKGFKGGAGTWGW
jgi:hypothetical protein